MENYIKQYDIKTILLELKRAEIYGKLYKTIRHQYHFTKP
jgi:hypothetical protein